MDNMEKVEKIRELANVSFEEAKAALEENNWDLLEAMVGLERQGKTKSPEQIRFSTGADEQRQYIPVTEKYAGEKEGKTPHRGKVRSTIRKIIRFCKENSFHVTRGEEEIVKVPVMLLVLALLFFWELLMPAMIIALFFNIRYHFSGKDDLNGANQFMDSAGDMADRVKAEFAHKEDIQPEMKAEVMTEVKTEETPEGKVKVEEIKEAETETMA